MGLKTAWTSLYLAFDNVKYSCTDAFITIVPISDSQPFDTRGPLTNFVSWSRIIPLKTEMPKFVYLYIYILKNKNSLCSRTPRLHRVADPQWSADHRLRIAVPYNTL